MGTAAALVSHRTWAIDAARSDVTFTAWVLGRLAVRGGFPSAVSGAIVLADDTLSGAATVAAGKVHTGIGRRDRHLRSAEFLDAARHDTIAMRVEGITRSAGVQRATAVLTIKGVTTTVPVEIELTGPDASLTAIVRGRLRRHDVHIVPSWLANLVVGEDVVFEARIVTGAG